MQTKVNYKTNMLQIRIDRPMCKNKLLIKLQQKFIDKNATKKY